MSIRNSGLRNRKLTGRCSSDTGYFAQHQVHYMLAKYRVYDYDRKEHILYYTLCAVVAFKSSEMWSPDRE